MKTRLKSRYQNYIPEPFGLHSQCKVQLALDKDLVMKSLSDIIYDIPIPGQIKESPTIQKVIHYKQM